MRSTVHKATKCITLEEDQLTKLIIEAAVNEAWNSKADNPHLPYTAEEIAADAIACAEAGASIVHFHSRDEAGDEQLDDPELWIKTVSLIREKSDIMVCPSYYNRGPDGKSIREELSYWEKFSSDPWIKPEITGICPFNQDIFGPHYDPETKKFDQPKTYIMEFMEFLNDYKIKPVVVTWEVGQIREVLAYHHYGLLQEPLNIKFFMSDVGLYGVAPTPENYVRLTDLLDKRLDWQVLTSVYGPVGSRSAEVIYPLAVALGHHIRVGIGDLNRAGFGAWRPIVGNDKKVSNPDLVRQIKGYADMLGREVASPAEAREILGVSPLGTNA